MCAIKMSVDMWLGNFDRKGIHCIPVGLNYPYSFMSGSCAEYHWIEMKNAFKEVLENAGVLIPHSAACLILTKCDGLGTCSNRKSFVLIVPFPSLNAESANTL